MPEPTHDLEGGMSVPGEDRSPRVNCPVDTWTDEVEKFVRKLMARCEKHSESHMDAGYHKKKMNIVLSIPPIVIPAFMTPIAAQFSADNWLQILSPIVYALVAVAATLAAFFGFARKSEQHFRYASNFNDLITDIEEELCKTHDSRRDARVFISGIKTRYDSFGANAPII